MLASLAHKMTSFESKPVPDTLAKKNPHERDVRITFDEGPHIYTVDNKLGFTSVTTWNHTHFPHFDAEKIVNNIMNGRNIHNPTYKYYGMTKEEILAQWANNASNASIRGTQLHYDIECFYNDWEVNNDSIEYKYFQNFVRDFPNLKPYRTEWIVFYEELKMSGSIDMVFEDERGKLWIYDWKRCIEIDYENQYGKTALTDCIKYMPDAKYWHYALQLNMYRRFLQDKYDKEVVGLYLVCLHPENSNNDYIRIPVQFLDEEMDALIELRKKEAALVTMTDAPVN